MNRFSSYIICATTRSGSTLLCKLLAATGVAGKPDSYFHQPSVSSWTRALDLQRQQADNEQDFLRAIFSAVQRKGSGGTNVFGLRLMRKSFDFLMTRLNVLYPELSSDNARFEAAFGRTLYIHLTRENKVAQAVSLVKANQTGLWHMAPDGTEIERNAAPQPLFYDGPLIARYVAELTAFDHAWERWFESEKITPLRVTYESLSHDPAGMLSEVLNALGLIT